MNDDDSRYLIDQFNKYASWTVRRAEVELVGAGVVGTMLAIVVTLMYYSGMFASASFPANLLYLLFLALGILIIVRQIGKIPKAIQQELERSTRRLVALEDYRSKHGSLPDGITFKRIVESKLEELEELLQASGERNAQLPGSTAPSVSAFIRTDTGTLAVTFVLISAITVLFGAAFSTFYRCPRPMSIGLAVFFGLLAIVSWHHYRPRSKEWGQLLAGSLGFHVLYDLLKWTIAFEIAAFVVTAASAIVEWLSCA